MLDWVSVRLLGSPLKDIHRYFGCEFRVIVLLEVNLQHRLSPLDQIFIKCMVICSFQPSKRKTKTGNNKDVIGDPCFPPNTILKRSPIKPLLAKSLSY